MTVRLNITIDDDLHEFLKRELPEKGISRFINDAIRARLRLTRKALDEAYKAADREPWRKAEARGWEATDIEGWPL
jgi:Arc/MetJ family transcription regulator